MNFEKFLVIQTASTGDVILATPVLEKLHTFFPGLSIDILVKQGNESLFIGHPFIRRVLVWDKKNNKYKNLRRLLAGIRRTKYDCVLNLQRFASSGFLTAFSGAPSRVGFTKNPFSLFFTLRKKHVIGQQATHEINRNLSLIESFTDRSVFRPALYPTGEDMKSTLSLKKSPYITISPASLWFTKQYPPEKWIQFLDALPGHIRVYYLGSPADRPLCEQISQNTSHRDGEILAGKLSYLESAALMRDAHMNFTNDSAPLHLASAVNAPVTAIFCSTVPAFGFGPLSDDSAVIQVGENLPCRPCGIHGRKKCPEKHFDCAGKIATFDLLKRMKYD